MNAKEWTKITVLYDPVEAEMLRGLLEAQGIQVLLSKEGAAKALGLSTGIMSEIEVLVPQGQVVTATKLLSEYFGGSALDEED